MHALDAAFAFALTMLLVSTIATQIVRFLQYSVSLRHAELKNMLDEFCDKELEPVLNREIKRLSNTMDETLLEDTKVDKEDLLQKLKLNENKKAVEISTEEMIEQLKRSDFGLKILQTLGNNAQLVFNEFAKRYEVIGKRFTASFRKKSREWTTIVAAVIALGLNIDSLHIAESYLTNESVREGVIVRLDHIVDNYNEQSKEIEAGSKDSSYKHLKQAIDDTRKQIDLLSNTGLPIGYSFFPYEKANNSESTKWTERIHFWDWVFWVIGIFLTSIFAGLGAPFWYDTVRGVSRLVEDRKGSGGKNK